MYNATGHPTQKSLLVAGTTTLSSSATYNSNGTLATYVDFNGATTTYHYDGTGGCNNLLLTSVSLPVNSLSTAQAWDCHGGVVTSTTDANSQPTTFGYVSQGNVADPFWRVLSMTDPLGNVTWNVYSASAPFTQETTLTINGTSAARDIITISDGLSRPIFIQTRQSPGSTAFDLFKIVTAGARTKARLWLPQFLTSPQPDRVLPLARRLPLRRLMFLDVRFSFRMAAEEAI